MRIPRFFVSAHLAIALSAAVLVGCASLPAGAAGPDGAWRLQAGTLRGSPLPMVPGSEPTLTVDSSGVSGVAACNHYGGTITIDGDRIGFSAMQMTEMACDASRMMSESAYLDALGAVSSFLVGTDSLRLSGNDVDLSFRSVPPTPGAALTGTAWELDALVKGDAVSSVAGGPATLTVDPSGALSGSTGCRSFTARAIVKAGRLQIETLVAENRSCSLPLAPQDRQVLDVLDAGPSVELAGRRLTLTGVEGDGLVYRAG